MTDSSPELVEKAANLLAAGDPFFYPGTSHDYEKDARKLLESVLPEIERPWQEKVERLTSLVKGWEFDLALQTTDAKRTRATLAKRDQEIVELRGSNDSLRL